MPSWVNQSGSTSPRASTSGVVPSSFGVAPAVAASRATGNSLGDSSQKGVNEILKKASDRQAASSSNSSNRSLGSVQDSSTNSALEKISKNCPQIENQVLEAIQLVDVESRISSYQKLSRRCPSSPDLQIWLARDYKDTGNLGDAKRSIEKALSVDPGNPEAVDLLLELRSLDN